MAKANNLKLDIVTITSSQDAPDYYRKLNRLAKVPTFVSSDGGFVLSECIAIALYSMWISFSFSFLVLAQFRSRGCCGFSTFGRRRGELKDVPMRGGGNDPPSFTYFHGKKKTKN